MKKSHNLVIIILLILSSLNFSSSVVIAESQSDNSYVHQSYSPLDTPVLLMNADPGGANTLADNLRAMGVTIHFFDLTYNAPAPEDIEGYEIIILWTNNNPTDPVITGNLLADFVDRGGRLITFAYSFVENWNIQGRLWDGGYFPLKAVTNDNIARSYNGSSDHPFLSGITSFYTPQTMEVTINGTILATYEDETPFVVYNTNVIGINSWVADGSQTFAKLLFNIIISDFDVLILYTTTEVLLPIINGLYELGVSNLTQLYLGNYILTYSDLEGFDAIILTIGTFVANSEINGDVLADYVDNGGRLIILPYTFDPTYRQTGRLWNQFYYPMVATSSDTTLRTYSGTSEHPLMTNVSLVSSSTTSIVTVNGSLIASYDDGMPFVAVKGNVIGINANPYLTNGDFGRVLFNVLGYIDPPPTVLIEGDQLIEKGLSGTHLVWQANDSDPNNFELSINGNIKDSGVWVSGQNYSYDLSSLSLGQYTFDLVINDRTGHETINQGTFELVDTISPQLDSPADREITQGSSESLIWTLTEINPSYYEIQVNGVVVLTSSLETGNSQIEYDLSKLEIGTYVITLNVYDLAMNSFFDEVIVTVQELPTSSSQTPSESISPSAQLPISFTSIWIILATVLFSSIMIKKRESKYLALKKL